MKKLLSILVVSCLCFSIVGCGKNVDNSAKEEVVAEEVTDSTEDAVSDEIVEEVLEDVENAEVEEVEIVEEAKEEEPAEESEEEYVCPECGAKITLDMTRCPNCGVEFEFEEEEGK